MQSDNARILSVPYLQELNDVPQIMVRKREADDFTRMVLSAFNLRLTEARKRPVVMAIVLHPI